MTAPKHVALVGCGFTGTSAFFQLVDRHPVERITIFEASGEFGPGYPYRTDECRDYLINNTTDTMCLVPSNRRAFVDWLSNHRELAPELDESGHLPRAIFGHFLKDVFDTTRTAAAIKGIDVRLVPFEAKEMRETRDERIRIGWDGGEAIADAAILTTGRSPGIDAYPHPPDSSSARYIANHVMSPALDDLPLDATVHILGASLSAYDVINRLFSPSTGCRFERRDGALVFEPGPNARRAVLCSRSGRLKGMQSRRPAKIARTHFTLEGLRKAAGRNGLDLDAVGRILRAEADAHHVEADWHAVREPYGNCGSATDVNARAGALLSEAIRAAETGTNILVDLFADAQVDIWDAFAERLLTAGAERTYRARVETAVLCYAAPCPVPTAEKLLALHGAGRLAVVKGVSDVRLADDATSYDVVHEFGSERADVLVNTTGTVDRSVTSPLQSPLISDLAHQGLLTGYQRDGVAMKGAAVDMKTFRAEGARNIYVANMLLWGPGFFTSSAIMMATVVERLLSKLFQDQ